MDMIPNVDWIKGYSFIFNLIYNLPIYLSIYQSDEPLLGIHDCKLLFYNFTMDFHSLFALDIVNYMLFMNYFITMIHYVMKIFILPV